MEIEHYICPGDGIELYCRWQGVKESFKSYDLIPLSNEDILSIINREDKLVPKFRVTYGITFEKFLDKYNPIGDSWEGYYTVFSILIDKCSGENAYIQHKFNPIILQDSVDAETAIQYIKNNNAMRLMNMYREKFALETVKYDCRTR